MYVCVCIRWKENCREANALLKPNRFKTIWAFVGQLQWKRSLSQTSDYPIVAWGYNRHCRLKNYLIKVFPTLYLHCCFYGNYYAIKCPYWHRTTSRSSLGRIVPNIIGIRSKDWEDRTIAFIWYLFSNNKSIYGLVTTIGCTRHE